MITKMLNLALPKILLTLKFLGIKRKKISLFKDGTAAAILN